MKPTEESVLALLRKGPMRPRAYDIWYAGSGYMQHEANTRGVLDALVAKGLAVKVRGGWYRLKPVEVSK